MRRVLRWIFLCCLLLPLLPATQPVAAENGCEDPLVLVPDQNLCFDLQDVAPGWTYIAQDGSTHVRGEEDAEPADDAQVDEDGNNANGADSEDTPAGSITFGSFLCDTDPLLGFEAATTCALNLPDNPWDISFNGTFLESLGVPGSLAFTSADLPGQTIAGAWTIQEFDTLGLLKTLIHCTNTNTGDILVDEIIPAAGVTITLADGDNVYCELMSQAGIKEDTPIGMLFAVYSCPAGYDPEANSREANIQACIWPDSPPFELHASLDGTEIASSTVQTAGLFSVNDGMDQPLQAGTWQITQRTKLQVGSPFVSCDDAISNTPVQVTAIEGGIQLDVTPGQDVVCDWYNRETLGRPASSLRISAYSCPMGYEPNPANWSTDVQECQNVAAQDFSFTAQVGDYQIPQFTVMPGQTINMEDILDIPLPSGNWVVFEGDVTGFAKREAYCLIGGDSNAVAIVTGNGGLAIPLEPGGSQSCLWFNIESTPRPEESLGLNIKTYVCPPEYDPEPNLEQDNITQCTRELNQPYTLRFLFGDRMVASYTINSTAEIISLAVNGKNPQSGKWILQEIIPPSWEPSSARCHSYDPQGNEQESSVIGTLGGPSSVNIPPGQRVNCTIFLRPFVNTGIVQVTVYTCPDGYDAGGNANRIADCTLAEGVGVASFDQSQQPAGHPSTGPGGQVGFTLIGSPSWFELDQQTGYDHTFATCVTPNLQQTITLTPESAFRFKMDYGDTQHEIDCEVFLMPGNSLAAPQANEQPADEPQVNEPPVDEQPAGMPLAGDAAIKVSGSVAQCPATITPDASYNDHLLECVGTVDPVNVGIGDSNGTLQPVVIGPTFSADIRVPGQVIVNVSAPEATGDPVAYCSSVSIVNGQQQASFPALTPISDSGTMRLVLEPGTTVYCDWFFHVRTV